MMGYNICFKEVMCKIIRKLSLLPVLIWSTDYYFNVLISNMQSNLLFFYHSATVISEKKSTVLLYMDFI